MRDYPTREIFEDDFPNVKGTALGEHDDELIVFVTKKVPEDELDIDDIVPTEVVIDGETYITDVIAVGIPHGQDAPMATTEPADHQSRHRPIPGGVSIGNSEVGAGTIGHPKLKHVESGDIVGLTNAHVSGGSDEQYQPAAMDGGDEAVSFGTLREASDLDPSEPQTTDSALIDVELDQVSDEILGIGDLVGFGDVEPTFDLTYKKSGRTTGITSGDLRGRDASIRVAYGSDTIRVTGCAVFSRMSAPGDSGSLIGIETDEDGFHATHLLFAGSDQATIAIPLDAVQAEHGELTVPGADDNGGDATKDWSFGEFRYACAIYPTEGVVDGDTIDIREIKLGLSTLKLDQRIRLLGVDTAERNSSDPDERALAKEQTQFVKEWLWEGIADQGYQYPFGLDTHRDEDDSFGRLLTHVIRRSDGESLTDAILEEYGEEYRYDIQEQLANLAR